MNNAINIERGTSLGRDAYLRLRKNKMAIMGLCVLVFFISLALLTPLIAPYTYDGQNLELGATPPSTYHWLGTDTLGRDQLTRIMYGSRVSLMVGFVATAVALLIGVFWGATAGFLGGRVDAIMMRIVDTIFALPFTIFIILLTVIFGSSMLLLFLAIGAVEWLTMARIVRGQVLNIKQQEFVEAAVTMGLSPWQIITRHLIPNVLGPIIVYTTLTIPGVILLESFLSFLGLGIQPPESSWGSLISSGVEVMEEFPWLLIFPGLALSITLFSLNFLGDGLRDALDPRTSKD
ncbi:peptide ABC transporter permease [Cellvibrio zantedeschiae]|uniref:Oligopeptide transport system permease protein OppC n=1 Tax=Cellvibrio zantedeschiae TaxID=1237077 RepID=A0ABQ3B1Y4_9GAMM|nr:ABC transporter permease [Cellvibrio zantedeschiae]GGY71506.1 peptide ABC transporter permease [Cellvibrio zantedeschiae]